tara:strand:- start:473 stop:790 length:318 start_codon:yes stop_codon:yes gene_type:complete
LSYKVYPLLTILDIPDRPEKDKTTFPMLEIIIENLDKMLEEPHTNGWWWCFYSTLIEHSLKEKLSKEDIIERCNKMDLKNNTLPGGIEKEDGVDLNVFILKMMIF